MKMNIFITQEKKLNIDRDGLCEIYFQEKSERERKENDYERNSPTLMVFILFFF